VKASKKILLVDDSATTLFMEKMLLDRGPFELITANNGEEAVRKALAEHPDLILLDVVMPRMDGFQACRALRADEDTARIPIIMVTTRGDESHMETGFAAGCNDYVTKPIDATELLSKIRSFLG
jgi:DNA-binding response OmpR family regulator